ncbi:MAG: hypothetical protein V2J07_03830 [Anaerolineae bacterium]|jgi:hypothetical protein|nr:hypothetical protein [Anaerolineae bacterium]
MELEASKAKKNTGLLPQFENPLATSASEDDLTVDRNHQAINFTSTRKALRRLFDQAKALTGDQLAQETAELFQTSLGVDIFWIARIDETRMRFTILGGKAKSGGSAKGSSLVLKNSPFEPIPLEKCVIYPRNALIRFANNPYMLKYNINGIITCPICLSGKVVGLLIAMNATTIRHPNEICRLMTEAASELAELVFS